MDYYKCENCGKMFDEFEMNYSAAQVDKKCWCRACREAAQQGVQADADYCTCLIKLPPLDLGDGMGACPSCNRPRR